MPRYTIANMHQWAKEKGYKCLSTKYKNITIPLKWQCPKGHIWKSPPDYIRHKTTACPECQKTERKADLLNRVQLFAKKRGGICLSTKYINSISPLKWKCKNGHIWEASPNSINDSKEWCKKCNKINRKANKLALLQKTAKQHGGKCLSDKYVNIKVAMNWQCKNKHVWNAIPERILNGHWCPECNKL